MLLPNCCQVPVIGSAPNADAASLAAARAADPTLIPCCPAAFDLDAIRTALKLDSVARKPAFVLLNAEPPFGKVCEEARLGLKYGGANPPVPIPHHLLRSTILSMVAAPIGRWTQECSRFGNRGRTPTAGRWNALPGFRPVCPNDNAHDRLADNTQLAQVGFHTGLNCAVGG
jgi:hypothetical protein